MLAKANIHTFFCLYFFYISPSIFMPRAQQISKLKMVKEGFPSLCLITCPVIPAQAGIHAVILMKTW